MLRKIWLHLKSWPEAYVMLPLVLLSVPGAALMAYFLTGRSPKENVDWIVDLSNRVIVANLVILFLSFTRQATGIWMSKQEQFDHQYLATVQAVVKMFCIGVFVWLFTH